MGLLVVEIVALAVVAAILLRRGPDRRVGAVRQARGLRWAALVVLALQGLFFLSFAIGEMSGGDFSGAGHLLQAAVVLALCWLLWSRPLETGAVMVIGGVLYGLLTVIPALREPGAVMSLGLVLLVLPQVAAGVLALLAGLAARRA